MIVEENRVIKRDLSERELIRRLNNDVLRPFWAKERLQIEFATIKSIISETTIPVPECQLYIKDGHLHLETKRITNGVLLEDIEEASRPAAVTAVNEQINSTIPLQLRSPRRNYIGSVDTSLPVFPP